MKILYIIGNGFDLNLKLDTSYPDFYDHFTDKNFNSSWTTLLQKKITEKVEKWSDFEVEFGKFTKEIGEDVNGFKDVYSDIVNSLSEYLSLEEEKLKVKDINKNKVKTHFKDPISLLTGRNNQKIQNYISQSNPNSRTINIINFNYTSSIETILGSRNNIALSNNNDKIQARISSILHIHGLLDERMLVGVNDASQISNPFFKTNPAVLSRILKDNANDISNDLIADDCKKIISSSDLILIYGSSLGITDKLWWEKIIDRLKGQAKLIIFHYEGRRINKKIPAESLEIENEVIDEFLSHSKLSESELEKIKDNIHVIINGKFLDTILN